MERWSFPKTIVIAVVSVPVIYALSVAVFFCVLFAIFGPPVIEF